LDSEAINAAMTSPSGVSVFSASSASDHGPFYLTEAGTYTVLLDGSGDVTGDYAFRLVDLTSATPISYGVTNVGQLAPQSRTAAYSFSGTSGQRLNLRSIGASSASAYWRLVSPINQTLLGIGGIDADLGEVVLPATGTYLVLVEGYSANIGSLDFQFTVSLVSNPSGGTSGFGTVRSGTVLADQTNSFPITGPAGLPVYFDALTNSSAVTVYLISASNELVFAVPGTTDSGPYVLPRSGTYTVEVVAGPSDGDFLFRLLDLNASSVPITIGTSYGQDFTAVSSYRADVYRLTGGVGQRVYLDQLEFEYDVFGTIYRPNGQPLAGFSQYNDMGPVTLDLPGTYYFILANVNADSASDYLFRWLDAAQPPAATVPFDTTVSGASTNGNMVTLYRFAGSAGQRLFFDGSPTNAAGSWFLYGPTDTYFGGSGGLSSDFEATLPSNGTYLLAVGNSDTTNESAFSFRIVTPPTTNLALTLGASVSGQLIEAGEEDRYTFTGSAGQRLYYDGTRFDQPSLSVFLLNPSGGTLHINTGAEYDAGPFTLTESGTYTLVLKATTEVTGNYGFRLIDIAQSPAMTVGLDTSIKGTNAPASSASVYRFTGTAGQRLFFDGTGTNAGPWRLYAPDNASPFSSASLDGDFEVTLPWDGTYVLVAGNLNETNAASFSFRIVTPTTTTNALTFAATVSGTLDEPGEEDRFTFTGSVGQRILYDALQSDYENLTASVVTPSGGSLFSGNSDSDQGMFTLTESGTHTLVQKAPSDFTGAYSFRLLDLAAGSLVTYGTTVSNQLIPQVSAQLYRISGVAGQRIGITNLGASSPNAIWSLLNPVNGVMLSGNILNYLGEVTLPSTGTYALLVAGNTDLIGGMTYQFRVSLISSASGPVSGFGSAHSGDTTLNQTNTFVYSGPAGRLIYFDALTNSSSTTVRLIDPNGEVVFTASTYDAGPYFLPRNGNYTLEVVGTEDGSYHFRLLDLVNDSVSAAFGTTYTQALTPPFRTDFYRFDATNGQRIFYDAESLYDGGLVYQTTYSPFGSVIAGSSLANYDFDTTAFTDTGTYYIALAGQTATDATEYSFRLLDAARAPTVALTLDTPVSGTNDPGTRENLYRFAGAAGQRLFFNAAPTNGAGYWYLYKPSGSYLSGNSLQGDFEIVLPSSGQYVLTAGNSGVLAPVSYSFQVVTPNTTTNPLTFATITTGSLAEVGEEDWFTFTGTAGQRLYFDPLDSDDDNYSLIAYCYDPLGNGLFSTDAETDYGPFTLSASGTYQLRIKHSADGIGSYAFRLLDTATATTLPYDTVINGFVTNTYGAQLFRVPAMANLDLIVDGLGTTEYVGESLLFGPNNATVGYVYFGQDIEATPPNDSPYLLVLRSTVNTNLPYSFQIIPGNHAPVLAAIGSRTNNEMTLLTFTASATDLEVPNDQLSFSLDPGAPAAAAINPVTGAFTWTPDETNGPGIYPVTVRVTDNGIPNLTDSETINIALNEVNRPPSLTLPGDQIVNELVALNLSASATDPDFPTNVLTFSLISPPSGMAIDAGSGAISWTPAEAQGPFTNTITVVVTDTNPPAVNAISFSVTNSFQIAVREVNVAPVLTGQTNRTINELTLLTVTNTATDSDLPVNGLSYALTVSPPGATISTNGIITWTPTEVQGNTTNTFTTVVTDTNLAAVNPQNLTATNTFTVIVNEINVAPVLPAQTDRAISELALLTVTNTAADSDLPANGLGYALLVAPGGAAISTNGIITWTPTEAQGPSTNTFTTVVTDTNLAAVNAQQLTATNTFVVIVNELNVAPVLPGQTNRTINELTLLTVTNTATDSDLPANGLSYALTVFPSGATISTNGIITWTPSEAQGNTTNTFATVVTDTNLAAVSAQNLTATNTFVVIVNEINVTPVLPVQTSRTINELTLLTVTNTATDSDLPANGLGYALTAFPPGATISANGIITWTPSEAQGNTTNIFTTVVTDTNLAAVNTQNLSATNTFTVFVNELNVAPVLALPPSVAINELVPYANNATTTDTDLPVNPLVFELVTGPSGLNMSAGGAITWTPTEAQGPGVYPVQVKVTDTNPFAVNATSLSVTGSFTLTVNEVNLAPTLMPPANRTIHAGTMLTASASATDPDLPVNALSYSKLSGPAGVNVSGAGLITWNTSDTDANTTNVIVLKVSDNGVPNLSHTNNFEVTIRSRPVFTLFDFAGSSATAEWTAISGASYRLQYRTNIGDATWADLAGDVIAGGATATKTDTTLGTTATRFYRVFVLP